MSLAAAGRGVNDRRAAAGRCLRWLVPAAAALVAVVWASPWGTSRPEDRTSREAASEVRVKGDEASLEIFRRTGTGSERLVDGRGIVTRHHPVSGTQATALTPGDTVLLDQAFELDDAPRWEQFHLVTSPTPFEIDPVLRALAEGDPARLPATLTRAVLSVVKEPRP